MTTFSDLGLSAALLKAVAEEGYTTPTPIQMKAVPVVLTGADLLGIAQTGTGKTAAFALPILQRLAASRVHPVRKGCRVLVLSPTRELATQIADSFRAYGRHLGMHIATVFGGVGHGPQRQALARGLDVLVATPGRLIDHMEQGNVALQGTEVLVLDEADQMLDLGFLPAIRKIVGKLSAKRQSLFFSATMPTEIGKLAHDLLREPVKVSVAPAATTVERVSQRVIHVESSRKRELLVELLSDPGLTRTLVFTRTKRGADRVARHLETAGIECAAIHGDKSQGQREKALAAFKAAQVRALVATDIAARGIDVDQVSHVINYEMPDVPEAYVHRIGRTARAGAEGTAISLVSGEERPQLRDIERITRQTIPAEDRRTGHREMAPEPTRAGAGGRRRPGRNASEGRAVGKPRHSRPQRPRGEERSEARPGRPGGRETAHASAPREPRTTARSTRSSVAAAEAPRHARHAAATPDRKSGRGKGAQPQQERRDKAPSDLSGIAFLRRGSGLPRREAREHGTADARHRHVRPDTRPTRGS